METMQTSERLYERYMKEAGAIQEKHLSAPRFISQSDAMLKLMGTVFRLAQADASVLLLGESGTGKSFLARYIHENGPRRAEPFVAVNCASIPGELLESEFFGYEPGAFTGARRQGSEGFLQTAGAGTLFLDEVAELTLPMQAKLLQVLQDGTYFRVGGRKEQQMRCRILAATNQDIQQLIEAKRFREDLYYRLNVFELKIPPLRQRREEIVAMAAYFLSHFNTKYHRSRRLTSGALDCFLHYTWPGNARELENLMERLVVISKRADIVPEDLPEAVRRGSRPDGAAEDVHTLQVDNDGLSQAGKTKAMGEHEKNVPDAADVSARREAETPERRIQHFAFPEGMPLDEAIETVERALVGASYRTHRSSYAVARDLGISQSKANRLLQKYHLGERRRKAE